MKKKWWVAVAESQEAVDSGAYEVQPACTKTQAINRARRAVANGKAAAYAVKHSRTVFGCIAEKVNASYDGLRCREWTPAGSMTFVPDPRI